MNRIVWVFGQSAAGKATFIENAMTNPDCELMQQLGYNKSKMIPLYEKTYLGGLEDEDRFQIIDIVLDILKTEQNAVIFIKWQHPDTGLDIIGKLRAATPDTPNEFVVLSVDSNVLYGRLQKKPWWNEAEAASFPQGQMDHVVEIMRNNIMKYLSSGRFRLAAEIDATDGYRIIEYSSLEV